MNLYRLDYLNADGSKAEGVPDRIGQQFLSRHMATARSWATERAAEDQRAILVTRIAGAGAMKSTLVVNPDGSCTRPPGSKTADPNCRCGTGRTCFCPNARAARRAG